MTYQPQLELALEVARHAGQILEKEFHRGSLIRSEEGKDIKLEADIQAEAQILGALREGSKYPILSEESGADLGMSLSGLHWVVDPLDGTFNFSRGIPLWCVSIALWNGDQPILGVVHEPMCGSTFTGLVGCGAWLNQRPIKVSVVDQVSKGALATGFPVGRNFGRDSLVPFVEHVADFKKVRLIGSAAISLALVASGSVEVYQEDDIQYWDVAAGLALVNAAGGRFLMKPGSTQWQRNVMASNGKLFIG